MSGVHAELAAAVALLELPIARWIWRRLYAWLDSHVLQSPRPFGGHP